MHSAALVVTWLAFGIGLGVIVLALVVGAYLVTEQIGKKTRALWYFSWYMLWRRQNNKKYPEMKLLVDEAMRMTESAKKSEAEAKWQESVDCAQVLLRALDLDTKEETNMILHDLARQLAARHPKPKGLTEK